MSLFTLLKISRTRYRLGKRQVPPGTPGAAKEVERSRHWYAYRRVGKKQVKVRLYTDKAASRAEVARLNTALERGQAGMTDPRKEHLERATADHLAEFLAAHRGRGRSAKDQARKEAILAAFARTLGPLSDLTHQAVDRYLACVPGTTGNRRKHLSAVSVFVKWLLRKDRIEHNPLDRVDVPAGGGRSKERRALAAEQVQKLLDAARERPLAEVVERYGREVKDTVRQRGRAERLKAATRAKMERRGRERALVYKTAVYTGLRLNEIRSLRPCHLETGRKPYPRLEVPGKLTKNGRQARLLLVPGFAAELAAWVADTGKGPDDPLFHVPQAAVRVMRADLKRAGIPYRTSQGDADFHSLRMTANVMLGQAGIPPRVRQLFMRHSDIRLTLGVYDDESFSSLEATVKAMDSLNLR